MPVPPSFVKNIAFQISEFYKLDNSPYTTDPKDVKATPFIGRRRHQAKFLEFLNGTSKKGIFLVTGYRGMGKTSFVNFVIQKYQNFDGREQARSSKCKRKIIPIHLTLAQNQPKEIDILKLLVNSVYDKYIAYRYSEKITSNLFGMAIQTKYYGWKVLLLPLLFLLIANGSLTDKTKIESYINSSNVYLIFGYIVVFSLLKFIVYISEKSNSPKNRIKRLMESCYATFSEENSSSEDVYFPFIKSKFTNGEKQLKQYSIAETKQIEYELQEFLHRVSHEDDLEFIFIFDELDKVDPVVSPVYMYQDLELMEKRSAENAYEREMRDRKQAIINIIASLKNFFTTADARFIFIAGREMFDASLADIADRQSSISSIFTYIFNIESLLKETHLKDENGNNDSNNASLSNAIESYLTSLLFSKDRILNSNTVASGQKSLYKLAQEMYLWPNSDATGETIDTDLHIGKIYFTFQNFITYLTYRSNGSPQKLIKALHEFIIVKSDFNDEGGKNLIYKQIDGSKSKLYLYFDYYNQYRIGFISYLYRPFLIKHGRKFKLYSDNIIVSTSYLFDHLLKFHPFAFSLSNLEMIPEVLSSNKTPSLREHIRQIIDHLGSTHIRETELSIFDYKFYSRTLNEISFLSKIFEPEAAAFNFTLDESFLIKLHVRNKIKELRSIYANFSADSEQYKQIFSISHLNEILGDLDFFDQEFDDAITSYSDAIKPLATLNAAIGELNMQDFITLIKNKLKLGLCFEKINSYEQALALYSDCCQDAKIFMSFRLLKGRPVETPYPIPAGLGDNFKGAVFYSSALSDVLQIVLQGFLSKIFIQEKMGVEGISDLKLNIALGGFLKIAGGFVNPDSRNHLLKANAFLFTGKLLYFKNNPHGFEIEPALNDLELILPRKFFFQIRNLMAANKLLENDPEPGLKIHRKPAVALSLYIMGLYEVLSAKPTTSRLVIEINRYDIQDASHYRNIIRLLLVDVKENIESDDESLSGTHTRYIATLLSNIGDCLLSLVKMEAVKYNTLNIADLFQNLNDDPDQHSFDHYLKESIPSSFDLTDVLKAYYFSGKYIYKYGRKMSQSFQFNKILYVLRMVLQEDPNHRAFLKIIRKKLVVPILQIASETSGHSDVHMLKKAKNQNVKIRAMALNNVSYHPETRETILLYNYLELKLGKVDQNISNLISPYNSFGTQYSRMMELDFYSKYVYETQIKTLFTKESAKGNHDEPLINYFFSRFTMLRILEIYGADYSLGFRFLAYAHYKIAIVLEKCKEYKINVKKPNIIKKLNEYLGEDSFSSLEITYHYQRAKDLYEKTIELHTGGKEYKKMINQLIYLEDDFNDNAYHFGAALDRYLLINGVLTARVNDCNDKINASRDFIPELYLAGIWK